MRHRVRNSIALFVLSLLLFGVQVWMWAHSVEHTRTETDKQNIEGHHPPSYLPIWAGTFALIAAGVVASWPQKNRVERTRS